MKDSLDIEEHIFLVKEAICNVYRRIDHAILDLVEKNDEAHDLFLNYGEGRFIKELFQDYDISDDFFIETFVVRVNCLKSFCDRNEVNII